MRGGVAVVAGGFALVAFVGLAAAGPPLVSAGLDQNVVRGDPVYLDAGGTHVPDGDLARLEWSVEAPNGSTIEPECPTCEVTWFRANRTGQYDVQLTARSESGVERSDTLYVSVSGGPGSTSPPTGDESTSVGGGDGSDGCFIAYEGDSGSPVNHAICRHTGDVVDSNISDTGDYVESYVVEGEGELLNEYDGVEYIDDGMYRIPEDSIHHQSVEIWEEHQDNQEASNYVGGGDSGNAGGNNYRDPSEEVKERIDDNDDMNLDTCDNVPSSYC